MAEEQLRNRRVAFLAATEGVEQVELTEPWQTVSNAGATAELISTRSGTLQAFNHLDKGDTFPIDRVASDVSADNYDALVLPGGVANPDQLRTDSDAVRFVREFFDQGKPVAVICHGPWTLIEADVVRGRRLTSYPSVRTDLENAGATWVDEEVVNDNGLISSRKPDDLAAFDAEILDVFARKPAGVA